MPVSVGSQSAILYVMVISLCMDKVSFEMAISTGPTVKSALGPSGLPFHHYMQIYIFVWSEGKKLCCKSQGNTVIRNEDI